MSLTLDEAPGYVIGLLSANALVAAAGIPALAQDDPEYQKKYEAALRKADPGKPGDGPGVVFSLWSTGGDPANGNSTSNLDLWNQYMLCVVENPKANTTGKTANQWKTHLLRFLHRGVPQGRGATADIRHPENAPAYEMGPLGQGLVIYFVNLEVRTKDELLTQ